MIRPHLRGWGDRQLREDDVPNLIMAFPKRRLSKIDMMIGERKDESSFGFIRSERSARRSPTRIGLFCLFLRTCAAPLSLCYLGLHTAFNHNVIYTVFALEKEVQAAFLGSPLLCVLFCTEIGRVRYMVSRGVIFIFFSVYSTF